MTDPESRQEIEGLRTRVLRLERELGEAMKTIGILLGRIEQLDQLLLVRVGRMEEMITKALGDEPLSETRH